MSSSTLHHEAGAPLRSSSLTTSSKPVRTERHCCLCGYLEVSLPRLCVCVCVYLVWRVFELVCVLSVDRLAKSKKQQ